MMETEGVGETIPAPTPSTSLNAQIVEIEDNDENDLIKNLGFPKMMFIGYKINKLADGSLFIHQEK